MPPAPPPLPRWLLILGSAAVVFHLGAVAVNALAAPSGPWPTPDGAGLATPPQLAFSANQGLNPNYLRHLKLTHNYHFASNRPGQPDVWFEVKLKDESGKELKTLRVPDPQANPWLRHRQELLARALADDMPVQGQLTMQVPAPGREVPRVLIWTPAGPRQQLLRSVEAHLVPNNPPAFRPSDWALIVARSYVRHL